MKYYFRAFRNYAECKGRATRKEYWWFILFHYIVMFTLAVLDDVLGFYPKDIPLDYGYMTLTYMFASACPSICLQVRRLHDVGKSGYWYWINNVPFLSLYLFYLNLKPSQPTINAYDYPSNYIANLKKVVEQNPIEYIYYDENGNISDTPTTHKVRKYGSPTNYTLKTNCNENNQIDNSNQNMFCRECGYELVKGSDFCSQCGTDIVKSIGKDKCLPTESKIQKFPVCIFDMSTHNLRKEVREIDIIKFPRSKFADNSTYYAIETIREGKKVRVYHTKNNWDKQIEHEISKTEN